MIAVENVRLFTELQASNRELTTALDTQTATSDILRVISRSQTDVQPVFDAILASAIRLLGAYVGALTRVTGDQIELAAMTSTDDAVVAVARALYPQPLQSAGAHAQALRARAPLNIADAYTDSRLPESAHAYAQFRGYWSQVVVPMLRQDEVIGTIGVTRREPGGLTDDEIALLQTFADQAVIAIENARLLSELQARTAELTRSVDELTALGDVGRVLSSTLDLEPIRQGVRHAFGRFGKDVARGLKLRCDWGPQYIADAWINEVKWLGCTISPSYVGEPQGNGVAERFMRTLKEQCIDLHQFATLDEARQRIGAFIARYNTEWLIERLGHRSPAQARAEALARVA